MPHDCGLDGVIGLSWARMIPLLRDVSKEGTNECDDYIAYLKSYLL